MRVTLMCYELGSYSVRRGPEKWAGRCSLLARNVGWEVVFHGTGGFGKAAVGFGTFGEARAWLDGDDGQRWLDELPRAEATP